MEKRGIDIANHELHLVDMTDISKTIYEIGNAFKTDVYNYIKTAKRPIDLLRAYYLLYLTASTPGDILRKPYPTLQVIDLKGYTVIRCTRVNQRHTSWGEREIIKQDIPIDNVYEKLMWDFITEEGTYLDTAWFLNVLGGYEKRIEISQRIRWNFKADLTDGQFTFPAMGLLPKTLRYLRIYNWLYNKGYDEDYVQDLLGLKNRTSLFNPQFLKTKRTKVSQLKRAETLLDEKSKIENMSFKLGGNDISEPEEESQEPET